MTDSETLARNIDRANCITAQDIAQAEAIDRANETRGSMQCFAYVLLAYTGIALLVALWRFLA